MNKIKINVDRPKISSKEIKSKMNFEEILANHQLMVKPFYKSPWFFGTTGLATVSIIATSIYSFSDSPPLPNNSSITNKVVTNSLITSSPTLPLEVELKENKNIINEKTKKLPIEKTSTLNKTKTTNQKPSLKTDDNSINTFSESVIETEVNSNKNINNKEKTKKVFNYFDYHPRISGKVSGEITKQELFDDKGLVTNTDVSIIHFELHLVDGTGGKVFEEDGHLLTAEMKEAIKKVELGNEIYFESIEGMTKNGEKVRLNPLRYTLLN